MIRHVHFGVRSSLVKSNPQSHSVRSRRSVMFRHKACSVRLKKQLGTLVSNRMQTPVSLKVFWVILRFTPTSTHHGVFLTLGSLSRNVICLRCHLLMQTALRCCHIKSFGVFAWHQRVPRACGWDMGGVKHQYLMSWAWEQAGTATTQHVGDRAGYSLEMGMADL